MQGDQLEGYYSCLREMILMWITQTSNADGRK